MKILLSSPYPYKSEKIWGGVEAVVNNLKKGFNKYEPEISLNIASGTTKSKNTFETINDIIYVKQPKIKFGSVFLSTYPLRIKKVLSKNYFDVLNSHEIDFAYYGLKYKKKLLFTLHGFNWEEKKYLSSLKKPLWNYFYVKRLYKILREIKYFVSINTYGTKLIKDKTNARIFEINNPVEDELFKIPEDFSEKNLLYIGVISKMKNLLTLVKAINIVKKQIPTVNLNIAGKIQDKQYYDYINEYIKKNDLLENINYCGVINGKQKLDIFSKTSCLILPSFNEHAPMVISEAFASARPVIASNVGGIPYMVENAKNGFLINPNKERDIANKIIYLLENNKEKLRIGKNARKYALKNNSLKNVVNKYKKAYEEIIS